MRSFGVGSWSGGLLKIIGGDGTLRLYLYLNNKDFTEEKFHIPLL